MDGLGSLGTFLGGNWQKLLSGGMLGAGEIGNLLSAHKATALQNEIMKLATTPGAIAKLVNANTAPLSNALTQSVGNTVQANLAERGLSQAPGIYASSLAQGLAPYQEENMQMAQNAILSALGLAPQTLQKPQDLSGAMKWFMQSMQKPTSTTTSPGLTPPIFQDPSIIPIPDAGGGTGDTGGQWG